MAAEHPGRPLGPERPRPGADRRPSPHNRTIRRRGQRVMRHFLPAAAILQLTQPAAARGTAAGAPRACDGRGGCPGSGARHGAANAAAPQRRTPASSRCCRDRNAGTEPPDSGTGRRGTGGRWQSSQRPARTGWTRAQNRNILRIWAVPGMARGCGAGRCLEANGAGAASFSAAPVYSRRRPCQAPSNNAGIVPPARRGQVGRRRQTLGGRCGGPPVHGSIGEQRKNTPQTDRALTQPHHECSEYAHYWTVIDKCVLA